MINISVINDIFSIWTAQDACRAREEFRIVGSLVGCLPRLPRQNIHLGLPLQLSPCEARLLIDKGFARLCDDSMQTGQPSAGEIDAFNASRQRLYQEQLEVCKESRQTMMMRNFEKIVQGKKKKLMMAVTVAAETSTAGGEQQVTKKKLKKLARQKMMEVDADGPDDLDAEIERMVRQQIENEVAPISLPAKAVCIQIHTANPKLPEEVDISRVTKWTFDTSPRDVLLYKVYSYFWEKGYYLTSGGKFGGDFLVYPGDPCRFHSFYIVICVDHHHQLGALEIVALGRLGTGVKKTALLCSVDSDGLVCCVSLKWTGIG